MNFNAEKFLEDAGIKYRTRGINVPKHAVNICCTYCGETRFHLVIRKRKGYSNCWVCKKRVSTVELVMSITKCSISEAREIVYGDKHYLFKYGYDETFEKIARATACKLPPHTLPLTGNGRKPDPIRRSAWKYLIGRSISVQKVEDFDLHYGRGGEQAYRIVIPMYFGGQLVNYTGRDFTGKSELRYRACSTQDCVLVPDEFLYGLDDFEGHRAIIVEGAFDRIALGKNVLAVNTNKLSPRQKGMLGYLDLKELVFVFDPGAFGEALELAEYFRPIIDKIKAVELTEGDPSELGRSKVFDLINKTKWFDF